MCEVLGVCRSSYYAWKKHQLPSQGIERNRVLKEDILRIYKESGKRYGSPKITHCLRSEHQHVSRKRVAKIMRELGVKSIIRKHYRVNTTNSKHKHPICENLLNREFTVDHPATAWVSDITYIRTEQGWLYLTIVMDLFDRRIIGWAMSTGMSAEETSMAAFRMARKHRTPTKNMIFHSDRGVQYACTEFRKELGSDICQSMSGKGNCWDNAVAESFFKILKSEMVWHHRYQTHNEAKSQIFQFIESWYNRIRIHEALGFKSPEVFFQEQLKVAS